MADMIYCEFLKLKRSRIALIGILGTLISPFISIAICIMNHSRMHSENLVSLYEVYDNTLMFLMLLFGTLVFSVMAAFLFSREYSEKTLKTIFAVPVPRTRFLVSKLITLLILVLLLMLAAWGSVLVLAAFGSLFFEIGEFDFQTILYWLFQIVSGGVLLYATLTPFVYLAIWTKGFLVPTIVSAAVVLVNVVFSGSSAAALFPWTATYLFLRGRLADSRYPVWVSFAMIGLVCIVGIGASIIRFQKEDIA